jgi:hypothetical protein
MMGPSFFGVIDFRNCLIQLAMVRNDYSYFNGLQGMLGHYYYYGYYWGRTHRSGNWSGTTFCLRGRVVVSYINYSRF